jgi:nitrate/nitrite-specific signal transduction histidine kinase
MQERADEIGGHLKLTSRPSNGTEVSLRLSLDRVQ